MVHDCNLEVKQVLSAAGFSQKIAGGIDRGGDWNGDRHVGIYEYSNRPTFGSQVLERCVTDVSYVDWR